MLAVGAQLVPVVLCAAVGGARGRLVVAAEERGVVVHAAGEAAAVVNLRKHIGPRGAEHVQVGDFVLALEGLGAAHGLVERVDDERVAGLGAKGVVADLEVLEVVAGAREVARREGVVGFPPLERKDGRRRLREGPEVLLAKHVLVEVEAAVLRDDGEPEHIRLHHGPRRRGVDFGELGARVLALDECGGLVVGEVRDLEVAVELAEDRVVRGPVGAFLRAVREVDGLGDVGRDRRGEREGDDEFHCLLHDRRGDC